MAHTIKLDDYKLITELNVLIHLEYLEKRLNYLKLSLPYKNEKVIIPELLIFYLLI